MSSPHRVALSLLLLLPIAGCGGGGGGGGSSGATPPLVVVTNLNDAGPGSLRDAIANVGPGEWIVFDAALPKGTITLLSTLVIDKPVVIGGLSGSGERFRLSGGNAVRIFSVLAGASLDLRDLELFDGNELWGGAILANQATIILSRVQFFGNSSLLGGGAIELTEGELTATACAFTACSANEGGALRLFTSEATLGRCSFFLNTASTTSGGAIHAQATYLTIVNTTFEQNQAPDAVAGQGGALSLTSGAFGFDADALIRSCTFTNNGAGASGGAIALVNQGDDVSMSIAQSIVALNQAPGGPDLFFGPATSASGSTMVVGIGDGAGQIADGESNQVGSVAVPLDPLLDAPAFHSGGRVMRLPTVLSPATDAIAPFECRDQTGAFLVLDQRGEPRDPATPCDVGAIEN